MKIALMLTWHYICFINKRLKCWNYDTNLPLIHQWDAFSIPELHNFLRILEKEEQDQICSITKRYNTYREKLEEAMRAVGGPG